MKLLSQRVWFSSMAACMRHRWVWFATSYARLTFQTVDVINRIQRLRTGIQHSFVWRMKQNRHVHYRALITMILCAGVFKQHAAVRNLQRLHYECRYGRGTFSVEW